MSSFEAPTLSIVLEAARYIHTENMQKLFRIRFYDRDHEYMESVFKTCKHHGEFHPMKNPWVVTWKSLLRLHHEWGKEVAVFSRKEGHPTLNYKSASNALSAVKDLSIAIDAILCEMERTEKIVGI